MVDLSRRLIANAVATRLATVTNLVGYYGQVGRPLPGQDATTPTDPPAKSGNDPRVRPYVVLFPGAGGPGPEVDLGDSFIDINQPFGVTVAGGDIEDVLAATDRVDTALYRWAPTVPGHVVGPLRPPPGYSAPLLTDRGVTPHRLFVPLQYVLTATT